MRRTFHAHDNKTRSTATSTKTQLHNHLEALTKLIRNNMAINYDIYKNSGCLRSENKHHLRIIENKTTTSIALAERIEKACSLTTSDVKAALSALASSVREELLAGNGIHLEGLGYLSLAMEGEIEPDRNGRLRVKHPRVSNVLFRPEKALMRKLQDAQFTITKHAGKHSRNLSEAETEQIVSRLLEKRTFFTAQQFATASGMTQATAYRTLRKLSDNGTLKNIGTPSRMIFTHADSASSDSVEDSQQPTNSHQ